jgi:DNA repair exonuclease SbcCD ATPase subunit
MKTDLDQKTSLHNDLKQMFHLKVAEFKDKTEKVQNYSRKLEELSSENNKLIIKLEETDSELKRTKRKLSDNESGARQQLKVLVDQKNNKIVEMKNELSKSDKMQPKISSKQFVTFKQMNSGDLQFQKSISGLEESIKMKEQLIIILQKHNFVLEDKLKKAKKSPVANIDITRKLSQEVLQLQNQLKEQSNPNETEKLKDQIVQLQARQQKQEAEYNKRVQTYITNLNVMKEKVKAAMMEKDSQIEQLKRQIHNRHEEIILI